MERFFRVESKDISDLNDLQLTKLLKLLLLLEVRNAGIAERYVEVALNITVADGGEDGRIRWEGGPASTDFLPQRFVQFQIKATNLNPVACAKEIINRDGSMKHMVEEALDQGAAYIIFINHEYNKTQKEKRIEKIRNKIMELGKSYSDKVTINIYDSAIIEGWVNRYIPAIVAVSNWIGRPIVPGLKTWADWSQCIDFQRFSFVADPDRQEALINLRDWLTYPGRCARLIGLSGLGKTRLAFEVFRGAPECTDLNTRLVYIDAKTNSNLFSLICSWVQGGLSGIVVVDDCDISLHEKLRHEVQRSDSKLSLLTLDYNLERSSNTNVIQLKQLPDQYIKQILDPVYSAQIPDIDRIVSFAQGFPQMAVLLAEARLEKEVEMGNLTDENLAHKMLWGGREPIERDERILRGCALFDRFGLDEDVSVEYQFIAQKVADVDLDQFYECVKRFEERGLIDRRGRYARLIPKPLAIRLAAEWWRRSRRDKLIEVINTPMPGALTESFCEQISRLDFLPEVKVLVQDLCGPQGPFGQAEVILSERGSRLFRALVDVNPEATSWALWDVLRNKDEEGLSAIRDDTRRNLVMALEKLCFHVSCFEEAANSLLLLASAENEIWANNATGLFKQLFHVFLSGTEAPPSLRMRIIESALKDTRYSMRRVAVEAIEEAIDTHSASRSIGAEYQGSGAPLEEWRPKVWGEVFDYWDWALQRLCELVVSRDALADIAKRSVVNNLRGLIQNGRVESLDRVIREIVDSHGAFWPEALDAIKDSLRYEGEEMPSEGKAKLQEWVRLLTPMNLSDRLRLYVSTPSWEHEKEEDGHYVDLSAQAAKAFAIELSANPELVVPHLNILLNGEQRMAYWFAKNLVESSHLWEPLLTETVAQIKIIDDPNISLLLGILNGVFTLDPYQWERIVEKLSETEGLVTYYANIASSGQITERQLDLIVWFVTQEKITAASANVLCYGKPLEHLSVPIVSKFAKVLSEVTDEAAWVALDILFMYCYGNGERWQQCRAVFREIVLKVSLDKKPRRRQGDIYHWRDVTMKLIDSEGVDFAQAICMKLIESCSEKFSYSEMWHYIQPLLREIFQKYSRQVWHVFSAAIKNADDIKRYRLSNLLGSRNRFEREKPSVLAVLPDDLLRKWCFEDPEVAPEFVAGSTDVLSETEEGVRITPRARFLLDNFGDEKRVLSALSMNLGSFGWTGSLVPYLLKELSAMEELKNHEKESVRKWVDGRIGYLTRMVDREKRRDEEHDWGVYG